MWKMTLKQRRRHGELLNQIDQQKRSKYGRVPKGYRFGDNAEEDAKYNDMLESIMKLIEELHELEATARERD